MLSLGSDSKSNLVAKALVLCTLLTTWGNIEARPRGGEEGRQSEHRQEQVRPRVSASQAATLVEQRVGGKVMNVQTRQSNGRVTYSVKILQSSGHMRTINVDGQTGAILN